jgi:hypothetical protein
MVLDGGSPRSCVRRLGDGVAAMTSEHSGSFGWGPTYLTRAQDLIVIVKRHEVESDLRSGSGQDSLNRRDVRLGLAGLETGDFRLGDARLLASERQ